MVREFIIQMTTKAIADNMINKSEYQKIAEEKIREQLKEININSESEKNAILFLDRILRSAGFLSIVITTTKS